MFCFKGQTLQPLFTLLILLTLSLLSHEASLHEAKERVHVRGVQHPFSGGASQFHNPSRFRGAINNNVFSWRRSLFQETDNAAPAPAPAPQGSSVVLAGNRTRRRDPTKKFRYHTGGWNVSNKHYLWSVGYSAAGPFIVSAIWLLGFGMFLFILSMCHCCCNRKFSGFPQTAYTIFLIVLIVLTVFTIIGSIVLFWGQAMFHKDTRRALTYIMDQANSTSEKLKIVYTQLSSAKKVAVDQKLTLPPDISDNVDGVLKEINASYTLIDERKHQIPRHIKYVLDQVILSLIIIATFMLVFTILGFLLSYLGLELPIYMFVVIGWILVGGLFILCGIFLLFHNAVGDTCLAMDQWVQSPMAHTALDDLLSCPDNATSQRAMFTSRNVTVQLLGNVNQFVSLAGNANFPPNPPPKAGTMNYNQSGPRMPLVCVPYNTDLTDRECAEGEVNVANATKLYRTFVCETTPDGVCKTEGRMSPKSYEQVSLAANVSYTLHYYGPFLVELMDCSFVRETFNLISGDYCPGLTLYSNWIYIGLSMVASGVMISVMIWIPYALRFRVSVEDIDDPM